MSRRRVGIASFVLFVGTVVAANWAVDRWGIVSVGFGLMAPAGVYFAGLAFLMRDALDQALGRFAVLAAICLGAGIAAVVDTTLALASAVAFLVSELCDWGVYAPLKRRHGLSAVILSNAVGAAVDSILFLGIAFGSLEFFSGQWIGKMWVTLAALPVLLLVRRRARWAVA